MAWTFGIISSILTALLYIFLELKMNFALHSFTLVYVIPAGALLAGLLSSAGIYAALYKENRKPEQWHFMLAGALGLLTLFSIYYSAYSLAYLDDANTLNYEGRGRPVSSLTLENGKNYDFFTYINDEVTYREYDISDHSDKSQVIKNKYFNWVCFCLEILGSIGGALILVFALKGMKYCEKCSRYHRNFKLMHFPVKKYDEKMLLLHAALASPDSFLGFLRDKKKNASYFSTHYEAFLNYCGTCGDGAVIVKKMTSRSRQISKEEFAIRPELVKAALSAGLVK